MITNMPADKPDRLQPRTDRMNGDNQLSVPELKRLLFDIVDSRADVCVRFRLIGEMWQTNYHRIVAMMEPGVVLENEADATPIILSDISSVMQFEIDRRFLQYQPHCHYTVILG